MSNVSLVFRRTRDNLRGLVGAALLLGVAAAEAQTATTGSDPSAAIAQVQTWFSGTLMPVVVSFFGVVLVAMLGLKMAKRGANKA